MPRGNSPRQPSRSGRHEGARRVRKVTLKKAGVSGETTKGSRTKSGSAAGATARRTGGRATVQSSTPMEGLSKLRPKTKSSAEKKEGGKDRSSRGPTDPTSPERVRKIIAGLDQLYPGVTCALTHRSAWELLVATILSAQCTDVQVNLVTPIIFKKYPTVQDFARLEPEQLQPDIRSTGFFRNKAKSVVGAARKVVAEFGGDVPEEMESLLSLPGVARKTANVVLGTWFKKNVGLVVDTHVTRISRRLELTKHEEAKKIEEDLMRIIPQERWTDFSHEVIWHGRKLCMARNPKCAQCLLETLCHAADKTWSTVEIHANAR
jgi:endonuclease III